MLILLLSGYAGSGKDAAALLLMEEMGFVRYAFADALKDLVAAESGLPVETFHDRRLKDKVMANGKTPRDLLLATARVARRKDMDVFARGIAKHIKEDPHSKRIVISDWRYEREYEFLRSVFPDAVIRRIRIYRDTVTAVDEETEHDLDSHPMDTIIHNNGSIQSLRDSLRSILGPRMNLNT
jgi:hypothetical protein